MWLVLLGVLVAFRNKSFSLFIGSFNLVFCFDLLEDGFMIFKFFGFLVAEIYGYLSYYLLKSIFVLLPDYAVDNDEFYLLL